MSDEHLAAELAAVFRDMTAKQEPSDPDFDRAWFDHIEELYEA